MQHVKELNEQQKEAVLYTKGPLLIIAGAGAGKTRVITHRMLHLLKSGVSSSEILAITFTNKAAAEMRERVSKLIKEDGGLNFPVSNHQLPLTILTFHALCVKILREQCVHIDLPKYFTIADESNALSLIKESLKNLSLDPKQFEPRRMRAAISKNKGELITSEAFARDAGNEYFPRILSSVWNEYEKLLSKNKSLDFDDLILKTVLLFQKNENVRKTYQNRFHYIHIDEYQDTNVAQYELSKLLAGERKNICVVGDMDQCVPAGTKIETPHGKRKVEKIKTGDEVISAAGHGMTYKQKVQKIHKHKFNGNLITIRTKNGAQLSVTQNHILFANLVPTRGVFYTYLMYRRDMGFRVGIVQSMRILKKNRPEIGLQVRCNQEHADKIWILKISKTRAEAQYFENLFAFTYNIPTTVFHTNGRKMDMGEKEIKNLYKYIPTRDNVKKLFKNTGLSFKYPHYTPQGTTNTNTKRNRVKIRVALCDDRRKSNKSPWGMSRLSINTTNTALKQKLVQKGFSLRKGKRKDWRFEITHLEYGKIEDAAHKIEKLDSSLSLTRVAAITKNCRLLFQPAANILPSMAITYYKDRSLVEDTVVSVDHVPYTGYTYDLDIENTHNYIANNVAVHNSIYSWRGADFRNIFNFEKDYPNAKTILLEENYRSTEVILKAANAIIKKNTIRKDKNLFTRKQGGEKIGLFGAYDEAEEGEYIIQKTKELLAKKVQPRSIAVLYRANFQSRVLEEAFLEHNIPYQVLGVKFFERKEVKDILSFIKASLNEDSLSDIKRVINMPPRGIGKVTLVKLFSGLEHTLPQATKQKVSAFKNLLEEIRTRAEHDKPSVLITFIIKRSGVEDHYKKGSEDDIERLENIYELAHLAEKYDALPKEDGVTQLLEDAALASDQDSLTYNKKEEKNAVRLMTVHAAKGLEFPYVFITGLEQDLFPHSGFEDRGNKERAEEERRLFYVALTRAERKAHLSFASVRTVFGSKQINTPSEFITDIDESLIEKDGVKTIELD